MTPPPAALRLPPVACLLAVALLLAVSGCGEESTAARETTATQLRAAKTSADRQTGRPAASGCPQQLDAFVASLDALRRQLAIGLSYDDYVASVKRLRTAYKRIPVQRLTLECLATGTPGEKALNKHLDAANTWGECLANASCTTTTIEPVLQRKWRIASRHLSEIR